MFVLRRIRRLKMLHKMVWPKREHNKIVFHQPFCPITLIFHFLFVLSIEHLFIFSVDTEWNESISVI